MATVSQANAQTTVPLHAGHERFVELIIYSHTPLFYWWPVWVVGYVMAGLTILFGETVTIGGRDYWIHPSKNVGVLYTVIFMLVILFASVTLRGLASVLLIVSCLF